MPTTAPTPTTTPPPTPPTDGFIGPDVAGLPTSGSAWQYIVTTANSSWGSPDLTCDQDNRHNVKVLAGALYAARTGDAAMRTKVRNALMAMIPTGVACAGEDNEILSMGRQLGAYVLAADYIGLSGADDAAFRDFLSPLRSASIGSHGRYKSLVGTALDSPHNWGTFALASLTAADIYLEDEGAIGRDWNVYRGYVNRATYSGFEQATNSWACQGVAFTPANGGCPGDALRYGAWPKDIVRGGQFPTEGSEGLSYTREIMQGVAVSAELLFRHGYATAWSVLEPAWTWSADRDVYTNHQTGYYVAWMVNARLGFNEPTPAAGYGRLFGYTDWLFGS